MRHCAKNPKSCIEIKYEEFIRETEKFISQFKTTFGLEATEITLKNIGSIKRHQGKKYSSIQELIEEPEHEKFLTIMEKLGYS